MKSGAFGKKLRLYADELAFAIRTPASLPRRARLIAHTLGFHLHNWRGSKIDPGRTISVSVLNCGKPLEVTLRPYAGDLAILYEIMVRHSYRVDERVLPRERVRTIIDAGAHIGLAALYLANRYPCAQIFSLEPNHANFALLRKNVQHIPRIVPIQACLTGQPDQTVFISTTGRPSHFQMNTSGHGEEVPGVSIEQLCLDRKLDRIDLLKLDIEGAEAEVLDHPAFLERVGVITAELHGDYDLAALSRDIAPYGLCAQQEMLTDGSDIVLAYRP